MEHSSKTHSGLFSTPFNNLLWRQLLSDVCHDMKGLYEIEVISPFGFELLEDKAFLHKKIRRYYCYLGIRKTETLSPTMIASLFRKKLFESLAVNNKKILDHFVIFIEQDNFIKLKSQGYVCQPDDKIIDIQCRYITHNILDDYANYIICSIDSLSNKKSDCADFVYNKRHRNRIYQLYLMLESLFNHLVPQLSHKEKNIYMQIPGLVNNRIDMFFNKDMLDEPATLKESNIYYDLINPRVLMIKEKIKSKNRIENVSITCSAYHVNGELEITIGKDNYHAAKDKIIKTYLQFF